MRYKVKIITDEEMWGKEEEKVLILDEEDLEHLKNEFEKGNPAIWEYETIDKKIIAEDMIRRIENIEVLK